MKRTFTVEVKIDTYGRAEVEAENEAEVRRLVEEDYIEWQLETWWDSSTIVEILPLESDADASP